MKLHLLLLALLPFAATSCEESLSMEYPVTVHFQEIVPISDYKLYAGGQKVDDPEIIAQFRDYDIDSKAVWDTQTLGLSTLYFPDSAHCTITWENGKTNDCDITAKDGLMGILDPVGTISLWYLYMPELFRYPIKTHIYPGSFTYAERWFWGKFTSGKRFEIILTKVRWHAYTRSGSYKSIWGFSNVIEESKTNLMGPQDTLLFRQYKAIFVR